VHRIERGEDRRRLRDAVDARRADAMNQAMVTGPKSLPTAAVPRAWNVKSRAIRTRQPARRRLEYARADLEPLDRGKNRDCRVSTARRRRGDAPKTPMSSSGMRHSWCPLIAFCASAISAMMAGPRRGCRRA